METAAVARQGNSSRLHWESAPEAAKFFRKRKEENCFCSILINNVENLIFPGWFLSRSAKSTFSAEQKLARTINNFPVLFADSKVFRSDAGFRVEGSFFSNSGFPLFCMNRRSETRREHTAGQTGKSFFFVCLLRGEKQTKDRTH